MHRYSSRAKDRRLNLPRNDPHEDPRSEFEHDRDRILHSGAFRRLQGKTQVVSPSEADLFRTRMTHSLECSQIGRALAVRTGADPPLVEAVCMAHDLGHPPFGHTGEVALQEIMARHGGFEGNAQSFRIVSRLEAKIRDEESLTSYGLNLTNATLAGMLKYPWAKDEHPEPHYEGKFGYYEDDKDALTAAREYQPRAAQSFEASVMDWDGEPGPSRSVTKGFMFILRPLDEGAHRVVVNIVDDVLGEFRWVWKLEVIEDHPI